MGQDYFIHRLVFKKGSQIILPGGNHQERPRTFPLRAWSLPIFLWDTATSRVAQQRTWVMGAKQETAALCGRLRDCLLGVFSYGWLSPGPNNSAFSDLPALCTRCNFTFPKGSCRLRASILMCFSPTDPDIVHGGLSRLPSSVRNGTQRGRDNLSQLSVCLLFFR